jgi:hypothetical protein
VNFLNDSSWFVPLASPAINNIGKNSILVQVYNLAKILATMLKILSLFQGKFYLLFSWQSKIHCCFFV